MIQSYKINDFEGPLDLLIHLIKENKMDIMDFEIYTIIDQYIAFINSAKSINLEVASEFLVMASTLIELKSRLLLPKPELEIDSDYEEISQDELVARLIEYKRYKEVSQVLKDFNLERSFLYTKPMEDLSQYTSQEETKLPTDVSLYDLIKSFDKMMKRIAKDKPVLSVMENNEMSMEKRTESLIRQLVSIKKDKVLFEDLIDYNNKSYVIVTFLALLDMTKKGMVKIIQDKTFDQIYVCEVNI